MSYGLGLILAAVFGAVLGLVICVLMYRYDKRHGFYVE